MMELDFATMLEMTTQVHMGTKQKVLIGLTLALIGKDLGGTGLVPLLDHQKYQKTLWTGIIVMQPHQAGFTARILQHWERLFKGRFVFITMKNGVASVLGQLKFI